MGRFLSNPAVKNQMTPYGLGQTVADYSYFYFVPQRPELSIVLKCIIIIVNSTGRVSI
jgi:hypothetical protein